MQNPNTVMPDRLQKRQDSGYLIGRSTTNCGVTGSAPVRRDPAVIKTNLVLRPFSHGDGGCNAWAADENFNNFCILGKKSLTV